MKPETPSPSAAATPSDPLQAEVVERIDRAVRGHLAEAGAADTPFSVELQTPRKPEHGDWATNVAMRLAKPLGAKPLDVAEAIAARVEAGDLLEPPEVAPPGFINLRIGPGAVRRAIEAALAQGEGYGRSTAFAGRRLQVEFVSANPTGPLHIGHGRNAVVGDTLARIYEAAGYEVQREYYFNDAGVQMNLLGESLRARYLQQCGRSAELPEDGYRGEYMIDIAAKLHAEVGEAKVDETNARYFTDYAAGAIVKSIRADTDALGIRFDRYFTETSLHETGKVERAIERLKERGRTYEKDGALWLKSTEFGDEKDRVLRKSGGQTTYLAPDIAYHEDKFERGFDRLVNVLGGDHHGYVARLKAAIAALGHDPDRLHCVLIQMVSVKEGGMARKLSTRAGGFTPLSELIAELGRDIVRFFYLVRAADSQMVFDIDLARRQSMDNPYYYIQYAHARCCSLLAKAEATGRPWREGATVRAESLAAPEERAIVFSIARLPGVVVEAAERNEPLPLTTYLRDLATAFHAYFSAGNKEAALRCLQPENPELTQARLTLIVALRRTLANGLKLLGLTPIERL
jgi:arginyl-tRNA synthetase